MKEAAPIRRYTIAWEPLDAALEPGAVKTLVDNWSEIETDQDKFEFDVDWERLYALEDMGVLRMMVLRCNNEIVGYNAFHVMPHIHARQSQVAVNDVLFVQPAHRARAGLLFIRTAERALKAAGVVRIHYSTKVHAAVGRAGHKTGDLLLKLGYRHDENMYSKLL